MKIFRDPFYQLKKCFKFIRNGFCECNVIFLNSDDMIRSKSFSAETNEETLFANSLFAAFSQVFSFAASVFSRLELTDKNRLQI